VREVWNQARNNQPAVIFLDECEGILGRRGAAETDLISADIVQAFLAEWDGVAPQARVWVIGATNRRDMLDDAILSRFGWEMEIALPGALERVRIFKQEMESVFPGAVIPDEMGSLTQGMSGRDLRHLASQVRTLAYPSAPSRGAVSRGGQVEPQGAQYAGRQRSTLGDTGARCRSAGTAEAHLPAGARRRDLARARRHSTAKPALNRATGSGQDGDRSHARQ
jgi:SpoVK/Ycf46/Vps4 family AAA+-type ATPase